jgi:glycosyltransferase involved in cell wall biosynthesis
MKDISAPEHSQDFVSSVATQNTISPRKPGGSPKVLFLARPFPPLRATACVRTWNIAKYLTRLGWDVTVVTPHSSVWKHTDNSEKVTEQLRREGIQQILSDHHWRCLIPQHLKCWNRGLGWFGGGICRQIAKRLNIDAAIGWSRAAERACSHLKPNDVDIILATGSPFSSFTLAQRLADRLGKPFVLDYRDLWSRNAHDPAPAMRRSEAELLTHCGAVTTVSPSWAAIIEQEFEVGRKVHVVPNGFDPQELAEVKPHDFGHFAIVYTGIFYPPARVISPVMAALKRIKELMKGNDSRWFFHYYGSHERHVREEAERYGVVERVALHGSVPRAAALSAIRGAGVAVVITSTAEKTSIEENGIMTGKIYEALGLGTRILSIAPLDSDVRKLDEREGTACTFTGNDIDGIASFLQRAMSESRLKTPDRHLHSWPHIVRKLDNVLRLQLCARTSSFSQSESTFQF